MFFKINYWRKSLIVLSILITSCDHSTKIYDPKVSGYVPDEKTATKIAEAVWLAMYGDKIYDQRPFSATKDADGDWVVHGFQGTKKGGGTIMIVLQPKDGKILYAGPSPGK